MRALLIDNIACNCRLEKTPFKLLPMILLLVGYLNISSGPLITYGNNHQNTSLNCTLDVLLIRRLSVLCLYYLLIFIKTTCQRRRLLYA